MNQKYYKLVRDRIPEIIEANGQTCITETLSDEEYLRLLDEKLAEELAEYQASKSLEELADLLEVMRAVVKARAGRWNSWSSCGQKKPPSGAGLRRRLCSKKSSKIRQLSRFYFMPASARTKLGRIFA